MDKFITAGQWVIRTEHKSILGEEEQDALVCWLSDTKGGISESRVQACGSVIVNDTPMQLPEILFGNNALELFHGPSGLLLQFEARGALKQWVKLFSEGKFEVIKVQEAKVWRARPGTAIKQQEYDWTWGTDYAGSCCRITVADGHRKEGNILPPIKELKALGVACVGWTPCPPGGIDRTMLRDVSSPILMYDDVVLFEDFIHDHGVVRLSVKTRIMPQCWFVLLRYWLRVDNVIMKVFDTRCFHKFGEPNVYRECTQQSASFASLRERGLPTDPSLYSDAESAMTVLQPSAGPFYEQIALNGADEFTQN